MSLCCNGGWEGRGGIFSVYHKLLLLYDKIKLKLR